MVRKLAMTTAILPLHNTLTVDNHKHFMYYDPGQHKPGVFPKQLCLPFKNNGIFHLTQRLGRRLEQPAVPKWLSRIVNQRPRIAICMRGRIEAAVVACAVPYRCSPEEEPQAAEARGASSVPCSVWGFSSCFEHSRAPAVPWLSCNTGEWSWETWSFFYGRAGNDDVAAIAMKKWGQRGCALGSLGTAAEPRAWGLKGVFD